jgi:hypothetical protein
MNLRQKILGATALTFAAALAALVLAPAGRALAVPGAVLSTTLKTPCWLRKIQTTTPAGPSGKREVIIGSLYGGLSGGAGADGYYDADAGDCGYGDVVNTAMPANETMFVRLESARAVDDLSTTGGTVRFELFLRERSSSCAGSITNNWSRTTTVTFGTASTYDWVDVDVWKVNVLNVAVNLVTGTKYYEYFIRTTVTPTGGTATPASQSGCFAVSAV